MSRHTKLLSAAFLLSALPLLFACDGPTGPEEQAIILHPASATLSVGQSMQFKATVNGPAARADGDDELQWFSSNPDVAEETEDGLVFAKAEGDAAIRARYNGYVGAAWVTVQYRNDEGEEGEPDGEK